MSREIIEISRPIPLIGCIAFGLIDRGTNLIQVRPISTCPLSCIFCSTNAGPKSKVRNVEYVVPLEYLLEEFEKLILFKGRHGIEAHIDTVGDPLTYKDIVDLVQGLRDVEGVEVVSMQTHGSLLSERVLEELGEAGLDRMNLSIDALNTRLARRLADTEWYNVDRVVELAEYALSNTNLDVLLAPVWVPRVNDYEIPKIISLAKRLGAGRNCPPLGIQKYEQHKYGRRPRGVEAMSWRSFYNQLKIWEEKFGLKLVLSPEDFGIHGREMLPVPYKRFEKIGVEVVAPGWLRNEKLAVTERGDRALTVVNAEEISIGARLKVRVVGNKHNILIGRPT